MQDDDASTVSGGDAASEISMEDLEILGISGIDDSVLERLQHGIGGKSAFGTKLFSGLAKCASTIQKREAFKKVNPPVLSKDRQQQQQQQQQRQQQQQEKEEAERRGMGAEDEVEVASERESIDMSLSLLDQKVAHAYLGLKNRESVQGLDPQERTALHKLIQEFETIYLKNPERFILRLVGLKDMPHVSRGASKVDLHQLQHDLKRLVLRVRYVNERQFTAAILRIQHDVHPQHIDSLFKTLCELRLKSGHQQKVVDLWAFLHLLKNAAAQERRTWDDKYSQVSFNARAWVSKNGKTNNPQRNHANPNETVFTSHGTLQKFFQQRGVKAANCDGGDITDDAPVARPVSSLLTKPDTSSVKSVLGIEGSEDKTHPSLAKRGRGVVGLWQKQFTATTTEFQSLLLGGGEDVSATPSSTPSTPMSSSSSSSSPSCKKKPVSPKKTNILSRTEPNGVSVMDLLTDNPPPPPSPSPSSSTSAQQERVYRPLPHHFASQVNACTVANALGHSYNDDTGRHRHADVRIAPSRISSSGVFTRSDTFCRGKSSNHFHGGVGGIAGLLVNEVEYVKHLDEKNPHLHSHHQERRHANLERREYSAMSVQKVLSHG